MIGNQEAENALRAILEERDKEIEPLRIACNEAEWQALMTGAEADFNAFEEAERTLKLKMGNRELLEELSKRLSDPGVQDHMVRRWAHLQRLEMVPNCLEEEVLADLISRQKKIEAKVNNFRPQVSGETVTMNQIKDILRNSKDMGLRHETWEASKEIGPMINEELIELIKARNLAARSIGFPDHYRMCLELQEIDEARLFSSLGWFATLSEDEFRRMKAKLDRQMADHFDIDVTDLEPWHYSDPFFQEAPGVVAADSDEVFGQQETLRWTKRYFKNIGLPIDNIFEKGDYEERAGKYPHALCQVIDRKSDVRVLLNAKNDTYWADTSLHEFGHAVYELHYDKSLPFTLRQPAHTSVTEAVAMFFGRLAREPEWLAMMFRLKGETLRKLYQPMKEWQRMERAILGRWILVMSHFERGLYRDPDQDQQTRWWDLVERFQLIRPPMGRSDKADWAAKVHIAIAPVYYHNYLLGEWMASQFHYSLIKDLNPEDPIWVNMPQLGEWFKEKIFKHGSLWHFNELIRNVTGHAARPDEFANQYLR